MLTKIFILYTGGTIGMGPKDEDNPYSPLEPKSLENLLSYVPGFDLDKTTKSYKKADVQELHSLSREAGKNIPFIELDNGNIIAFGNASFEKPVDSSDIGPNDWKKMAEIIYQQYDQYDGFIILHGTDTMAFTASALSFMFGNLGKPIVITGSQLPISVLRTDAILNLINAIQIVGYKATNLPLIPEVIIVFADKIIRGCRATKVSTSDYAGFDSPNFPPLGTIGKQIEINTNIVLTVPAGAFCIMADFDKNVSIVHLFPGFSNDQIKKLFQDKTIRGYILRTYGTGNVPNNIEFLDIVKEAINNHKMVVNLSQCIIGTVEMGLYEASSGLMEIGVLSGLDMTLEAANAKLMWILGTNTGRGFEYCQMQINQRGEQTENLFDLRFGGIKQKGAKSIITLTEESPDNRLDKSKISNALLRISNLGITGKNTGDHVKVHVFMDMPEANHETIKEEEQHGTKSDRHIATLDFEWNGIPRTHMQNITYRTQMVIPEGQIAITLVTESKDVKIYFSGLFFALNAKV